jgi:uncharacterized membrane protein
MDVMNLFESLFRWIHVLAGIMWIGHLYYFNFVNSQFEPTLDAESKKKVIPELRPRALYWFRWGAAFTWVTGVLIALMVFYHGKIALEDPVAGWTIGAVLTILVTFTAFLLYDFLAKSAIKDPQQQFIAGIVFAAIFVFFAKIVGGFSPRGYAIHLGALFGTTMAYNVWFRIWPAQQQIITAIKNGQAPDPALVALAGSRSKHNTYMSVPLVFLMLNAHNFWAYNPIAVIVMVAIGFYGTFHLYNHSTEVKGF